MPGSVTLPSSTLVLGPWRIDRITIGGPISVREGTTGLFFMPDNRPMRADDGTAVDARADDLVILPTGGSLCGIGQSNRACTRLSAPRPFLAPALPHRSRVVILRRSGSVDALRCHVERLRAIKADMLDTEQVKAAACSIRELLTAAMMPVTHVRKGGAERENALLDRILEHVDATLGSDVSIASLCKALACSRSALYRAAAPRGGLIKIVIRQRLMAVHGALGQHGEQRSIAEIARLHGFVNASHFSRCFRRTFGVSAARHRQTPGHGPADGMSSPAGAAGR